MLSVHSASLPATAPRVGNLHRLDQQRHPHARCLDGSPGSFYLSPAPAKSLNKDKWFVFLQGGVWCSVADFSPPEADTCWNRARGHLGSSKGDIRQSNIFHCTAQRLCISARARRLCISDDVCAFSHCPGYTESYMFQQGAPTSPTIFNNSLPAQIAGHDYVNYFSSDSQANPTFFDWNIVFLNYCDGSAWQSRRQGPFVANSSVPPLFFGGGFILDGVLDDLLENSGLMAATNVVIGGASAGGVGTYANLDAAAARIHAAQAGMNEARAIVAGMPDGGFFVWKSGQNDVWDLYWKVHWEVFNTSSGLHTMCKADEHLTPWRCSIPNVNAKYLKTPFFSLQSRYDPIQALTYLPIPQVFSFDVDAWNAYGTFLGTELFVVLNASTNRGGVIDSCLHHISVRTGPWQSFFEGVTFWFDNWGVELPVPFGDAKVRIADAFTEWYDSIGTNNTEATTRRIWNWDQRFAKTCPAGSAYACCPCPGSPAAFNATQSCAAD